MGKFDLGNVHSKISNSIDKNSLYINKDNSDYIVHHLDKQLDIIRNSLLNINNMLNQTVNKKLVTGSRIDVFKGWSRKAKAQAKEAEILKVALNDKYFESLETHSKELLDNYISEVESQLNSFSNE